MSHDTLSDVLRIVRLRGAVFFYVSGGKEWAAESPSSKDLASTVMPGAEHVMQYHVVTDGSCWAGVVGEAPRRLAAGDIVLFPHGDAHVVSSAPDLRAEPRVASFYEAKIDRLPIRVTYDGLGGPMPGPPAEPGLTTIVCGFLSCDVRPFNPLVANLPRMLHLQAAEGGTWIAQFLQRAAAESHDPRPGSEAMLARMSEMLFVDAVRRYVDALPPDGTGWLAGLRDRFVGRALALLHERPADAWSLDELGRQVGLSRSALHERFSRFVGQPPMQYLAQWRMQLAAGLLQTSNATVATVALEVGYDSEAAFARAFKRVVGLPPAAWRRAGLGAEQGSPGAP
ncbi:MAG TPA: AraC family transcriptional regulator [Usitatibacter sp.]|nr:AraC family transcriptional regulator [Usitatibacter sp.]